jgi:hypothetical protein
MTGMAGAVRGFQVDQEEEEGQERHQQNVDDARAPSRGLSARSVLRRIGTVGHGGTLTRAMLHHESMKMAQWRA